MKYKAILFDLDNTLLDYTQSERTCMQQALKHYNLHQELTWDAFWNTFGPINYQYWVNRTRNNHHIRQVLELSFSDTFGSLKHEFRQAREISETYWELFCSTCHQEPHADVVLEYFHGKAKLGIISNGIGEAQRKRLAAGGLSHYFNAVIISDEVACWKPDPQIFEFALLELELGREDVLYIGDSLTDDCEGARRAGIDFCFYNPHDREWQGLEPKYVIKDLLDIKKLV